MEKLKIEYKNNYYTDDEQLLINLIATKNGNTIYISKKEIKDTLGLLSNEEVKRTLTSFLYEVNPRPIKGIDMGKAKCIETENDYIITFTPFGKYIICALNELCKAGVVPRLPNIKKDTSKIGKDIPGYYVYKLFENEELVYIGQSKKPIQRVLNHINGNLNNKVNYIGITKLKSETEMTALEMLLISKYQPKNNTQHQKDDMNIPFKEPKFKIMSLSEFLEGGWTKEI